MLEATRPERVVAVQAEAQYESMPIAERCVRMSDDGKDWAALPCYASHSLDGPIPGEIDRLLVVVHGALRDAGNYLAHAEAAAQDLRDHTLIVAPQFLADVDLKGHAEPWPGTLFWDAEGWKGGGDALGSAPISSFTAMDRLLDQLTTPDRLPGGRTPSVVIFGNSAGGQYVNRYAAVGRGPALLAGRGIDVRFVISNPSTYLYFTTDRPKEVPGGTGINRWRYGFEGAPAYVEGNATDNLRRYLRRDVTIVLGREDRDGAALLLETGAAAMAQGANRYDRGINYRNYILDLARDRELDDGLKSRHRLIKLDGVGHSAGDVMAAEETRKIIFG
jgi:hypothetical protein